MTIERQRKVIEKTYDEQQDVISVNTPEYNTSVKADYSIDLGDNLDVLLNKLLEKYPQLIY